MTPDEDPELEFSPLGGTVNREGIVLRVHIYRIAGDARGWALEVTAPDDTSTTWDDLFQTEQEALDEFESTIREHGPKSFLDEAEPAPTVH